MPKKDGDEEGIISDTETDADSLCFLSNGQRKVIRVFIAHEDKRGPMDIQIGKPIKKIKEQIQDKFHIQTMHVLSADENQEKKRLVLSFAGSDLKDNWVLSDLAIPAGSTIHAYVKSEIDPILYLDVGYNNEVLPILDKLSLRRLTVTELRSVASAKTGLPVTVFRMLTTSVSGDRRQEMFDCHPLSDYAVRPGDTIRLDSWDGWNDLLNLSALGFTKNVLAKIAALSAAEVKFEMQVALYVAAHFGHVDLVGALVKQGARPDEPVGEHPARRWCLSQQHVDMYKTPIHEAVQSEKLNVVRSFLHHDICSVMAVDGRGLRPLNIALRLKLKPIASFLLTKQWCRVPFQGKSIPLAVFARMKKWGEKAKEHATVSSTNKNFDRSQMTVSEPLLGKNVAVIGYGESPMRSLATTTVEKLPFRGHLIAQYYKENYRQNPKDYFRKQLQTSLKPPKQLSKWDKMAQRDGQEKIKEEKIEDVYSSEDDESMASRNGRLPPLKEHGKTAKHKVKQPSSGKPNSDTPNTKSILEEIQSRPSTARSVYMETGKQKPPEKKKRTKLRDETLSAVLLAKAKATEGAVPLPLKPIVDCSRPFYHVGNFSKNYVKETLDLYEQYRGMKSRDHAVYCLSVANSFSDRPWLHQVRLAMSLTNATLKKVTAKRQLLSSYAG